METEYVFLDSTEFVSNSFNFESHKLTSLRDRGEDGTIKILTTDVVYREVIARIARHAEEAQNEVKRLVNSDTFRTLRHLIPTAVDAVRNVDFQEITERSKAQLDEYITRAQIAIVDTADVRTSDVLELYFGKQPPFGEGKKKDEFPDAISLLAIRKWSDENNRKVYVVSKDGDVGGLAAIADSFIPLKDLGEFLEIVTEYEQDQEDLEEFIRNFSERFKTEIEADIAKVFGDRELVDYDYDIEAEFDNLEVKKVILLRSYVIDGDSDSLTLDVQADVTFQAHVSHHDYDTAAYDKEDDKYFFINEAEYKFEDESVQEGTLEYEIVNMPPKEWEDVVLTHSTLKPELIELDVQELSRSWD